MTGIFRSTAGPEDWKYGLADPEKQWKAGYSAHALAHSWEDANGFPDEVAAVLDPSNQTLVPFVEPLLGVPEYRVPLPGGSRPSQNDLFVLGRTERGLIVNGPTLLTGGPCRMSHPRCRI